MRDLEIELVGDGVLVPCIDGVDRPYLSMDAGASTSAMRCVAEKVTEFLPNYSSVHRGAGHKSQLSTVAYEGAREAALAFAGRPDSDVAIFLRNTTEAINHLAYRLALKPDDVVVTTVLEHHANLLPWRRYATCRYVDVNTSGMFTIEAVIAALDASPKAKLLAISGASNVTGWLTPIGEAIVAAHARDIPVFVDAAQLAPHRPLPRDADYIAWSGHKMYAPFGSGVLIGPRATFAVGDPFLAGGGAVNLVDLDEVIWTDPPDREEAGSPNVVGAVALHAAIDELTRIGWPAIVEHERALAEQLRNGLAALPGVSLLGPPLAEATLAVASFVVDGMPHALVAARLSAEHAIGVRHGCFCAHPYLLKLLDLSPRQVEDYRAAVLSGDRRSIPGAVRASAGISTTPADIVRVIDAVRTVITTEPAVRYHQDQTTGDFWSDVPGWSDTDRRLGSTCARG